MQAVSDRISQPALRRLQLRMRPMLRPAGGVGQARQSQGGGNAGGHRAIRQEPATCRDSWFAERAHLGTPLSSSEFEHGVRAGIIGPTLLM